MEEHSYDWHCEYSEDHVEEEDRQIFEISSETLRILRIAIGDKPLYQGDVEEDGGRRDADPLEVTGPPVKPGKDDVDLRKGWRSMRRGEQWPHLQGQLGGGLEYSLAQGERQPLSVQEVVVVEDHTELGEGDQARGDEDNDREEQEQCQQFPHTDIFQMSDPKASHHTVAEGEDSQQQEEDLHDVDIVVPLYDLQTEGGHGEEEAPQDAEQPGSGGVHEPSQHHQVGQEDEGEGEGGVDRVHLETFQFSLRVQWGVLQKKTIIRPNDLNDNEDTDAFENFLNC